MLYWSDKESAEKFHDLYNSVLAYATKKTGSYESFFNVAGTDHSMTTFYEMWDAVESLRNSFSKVKGYHGMYLQDMLQAMEIAVRLLNDENISYKDAIKGIVGIDLKEISEERRIRVRKEIDEILTIDGYTQSTTEKKVSQWYADNLIKPEQLADTASEYLEIIRRETKKIISVPEKESIGKLELVQNVPWAAFSQYTGHYITNMLMNRDSIWKRPTFIDLVSHELYPGHHTWYCMRESGFRNDEVPLEAATMGVFSAENLLFEGIPESGAHFIGIDNSDYEVEGMNKELRHKIMVARKIQEYVRIIEVNSCYHCHVDHWTKEQIMKYTMQDGWIEKVVAERIYTYFSHPVNGLYYPAYYYGRWIVTYAYDRIPEKKRKEFFNMLYREPHSTSSFIKRIEEMTGESFDPIVMAQN